MNGRTFGSVFGVLTLLATLAAASPGQAAAAPASAPAELAIVLHSPGRGVTAALRLSDTRAVPDDDFSDTDTVFVTRLCVESTQQAATDPQALGQAFGSTAALGLLEDEVLRWKDARSCTAIAVTFDGASAFEGRACADCVAVARARVAAASAGLRRAVVTRISRRLEAVDADPVDVLLDVAADAAELWPHRKGPAAGMLVAVGGERAREAIAVDRHGAVGRRLVERHVRHLADVELPRQLDAARRAADSGKPGELERRRTLGLALAARVIAAYPRDVTLLDLRAELEQLRTNKPKG